MLDRNENLRFTLRHLFILVSLLAAALSAGRATGSVALSIHLMLLIVGWVMYRFLHANLAGLIPCLLGFDYFAVRGIGWVYFASEGFFLFDDIFNLVASLLVIVGASVFLFLAAREQPGSRWQLVNAIIFFTLFVAWWLFIPGFGQAAVAQRQARDAAQNNTAMAQAIAQVESVRQQLGHVPTADELASRLNGDLPHVRDGSYEKAINYQLVDDQAYRLWFIIDWGDIKYYESTQPQKGWQVEPF